jgi:periplasmic protein CpxP/Spy
MPGYVRRYWMALSLSLTALLLVGAAFATTRAACREGANSGERGGLGRIGRMLADLDLTNDQKDAIKAILNDERPGLKPLVDETRQSKKALFQAIHGPTLDEKAVRAAGDKAGKSETALALEKARLFAKVREVLTPEQRRQLDQAQEERLQRMGKRGGFARSTGSEHPDDSPDAL